MPSRVVNSQNWRAVAALMAAVAPILGGVLVGVNGWRSIFAALFILGLGLLGLTALTLEESLPTTSPDGALPRESLGNGQFWTCLGISAVTFFGMFGFVAGSPVLLMERGGMTSTQFGLTFFCVALGFSLGARINRFTGDFSLRTRLTMALLVGLVSGAVLLGASLKFGIRLPVLVVTSFFYYVSLGMLQPVAISAALAPFRRSIGTASSWLGCAQMSAGALASFGVGRLHDRADVAIGGLFLAAAVCGLLLVQSSAVSLGRNRGTAARPFSAKP